MDGNGHVKRAVVLLSGGLDSTTTLALAKGQGYELYALTIDYGQSHQIEIESARKIASYYGARRHVVIGVDLRAFGGSALTGTGEIPKGRGAKEIGAGIPVTYVPARNTIFLALALAWAEGVEAGAIFIGVNSIDYSGYPDCRPEFIERFQNLANFATRAGVDGMQKIEIKTPLIRLSKGEIIKLGLELGVDYSQTITCYDPSEHGVACGLCDACLLRLEGFAVNNIADPAPYVEAPKPFHDV